MPADLRLAILTTALFQSAFMALNFFFPLYFKQTLGFSGAQIGMIFGFATIAGLLSILPIGVSNDRLYPKRMVMMGVSAAVLFHLLIGSVGGVFAAVAILFIVRTVGRGLFSQSMDSLIYKSMSRERPGGTFGRLQLGISIGMGLGMMFGGWFLTRWGFEPLFVALGIFLIGVLALAGFLHHVAPVPVTFLHYKKEILRPKVLLFILILVLFAVHMGAEATSYGLFLSENLHLSRFRMGAYMATELLFLGLASLALGRRYDAGFPLASIVYIGLLCSGIGQIGMTVPDAAGSLAFRALHGVGDGAMFLTMRLGINKFFHISSIGGTGGLTVLGMAFGGFFSSLVFGPLGEAYGYHWPLILSGIIVLLAAGLTGWYRHLLH